MHFRKTAVVAALLASIATCAAPAASHAAAAPYNATYQIAVNRGILRSGNTVTANVSVNDPQPSLKESWSRAAVGDVVRQGVNGLYEEPYIDQGYRCVPTIPSGSDGNTVDFNCTLTNPGSATTVRLTFTAAYKPAGSDR